MSQRLPARRRVSSRRYQVRRIGALVVLAVIVLGVVRVVGSLGQAESAAERPGSERGADVTVAVAGGDVAGVVDGGGGTDTVAPVAGGADDPDAKSSQDTNGAVDPDDADAVDADPASTPETPQRSGPPTPEDPARVLIMGDSDAGTFGPYLQQLLGATGIVRTELDYKVSSGLARPDFYDWHDALREKVPPFDPDIVVVTFGGNDAQFLADVDGSAVVNQPRPDADNSEWTTEYRDRVRRVVEFLEQQGAIVIWVGIPNHVNPEVSFRMEYQDRAVKSELAEHPDVRFVDTWTRFAGRNGGFAEFVIDPRDGQGKPVRASDGFHLNQTGAEILAIDIFGVLADELRALGATL